MALGIDSGEVFNRVSTDFTFELATDDVLLLYTDGATEALDAEGMEFGLPKLVESLQSSAPGGAQNVVKRLRADLAGFIGKYPQNDDVTMIAIRRK